MIKIEQEIKDIITRQAVTLQSEFEKEVQHLCYSGTVDDSTSIGTLFRVALENIAMRYDRGNSKDYRNLKKF
jgi:hypothetical protein